jgi:hypothetical protein
LFPFYCIFVTFSLKIIEYYFFNYYQYLLDYPSVGDEVDSDFVMEENQDNHDNDSHLMDSDMVLSSSDSEQSSDGGNVQEDHGQYCFWLQQFHRDAFYSAYLPEWEKANKSSHLISKEKYNEIVPLLRTKCQKKEPACLLKYCSTSSLRGDVEGRCLYRKWNGTLKVVPTIENVFDVILDAHLKEVMPKGSVVIAMNWKLDFSNTVLLFFLFHVFLFEYYV